MVTTIRVEDSTISFEIETSEGIQSLSWDINTLKGNVSLGSTGLISSQFQQIAIVAGMGLFGEISKIKEQGLYWLEQQGSETSGSDTQVEG